MAWGQLERENERKRECVCEGKKEVRQESGTILAQKALIRSREACEGVSCWGDKGSWRDPGKSSTERSVWDWTPAKPRGPHLHYITLQWKENTATVQLDDI